MKKQTLFTAAFFCSFTLLTGCGLEQHTTIDTSSNTIRTSAKAYLTTAEKAQLELAKTMFGRNIPQLDLELNFADETKDGTAYHTLARTYEWQGEEIPSNLIELSKDKFVLYKPLDMDQLYSVVPALFRDSVKKDPEFFYSDITFDKTILDTNGTQEGENQVSFSFDDIKQSTLYACFTEKAAKCKTITADASRYTKKPDVRFTTDGVITGMTIDGAEALSGTPGSTTDQSSALPFHQYSFDSEKSCRIKLTLSSGFQKEFTFTYDKTAPKITVKKNKISVSDKNGVKKITLNGKKIANGKKVTKKGTYLVKAWDQAGNVRSFRFKHKK